MNRLRAACLFLKGGSSAVCSVVSRWEFVSLLLLLLLPKLQSYLHVDSSSTRVPPSMSMYLSNCGSRTGAYAA
jgi:hypothetical protein